MSNKSSNILMKSRSTRLILAFAFVLLWLGSVAILVVTEIFSFKVFSFLGAFSGMWGWNYVENEHEKLCTSSGSQATPLITRRSDNKIWELSFYFLCAVIYFLANKEIMTLAFASTALGLAAAIIQTKE